MLERLYEKWVPKNQLTMFTCFLVFWLSSIFYFLFVGGKLSIILVSILTLLTVYPIMIERWSGIRNIKGTREIMTNQLVAGSTVEIKMNFELPGLWPITYVFVKDSIYYNNNLIKTNESSFVPNTYGKGEIEYKFEGLKRGVYQFRDTECVTGDIFNIFHHKSIFRQASTFFCVSKNCSHCSMGIY
ncbi:MAG: hypothetical protein LRY73_17090 [Bacillus sp. (in: Bacteria)]|nr:hypothetical protein [Bacillus sp. (in: firmicutes)]